MGSLTSVFLCFASATDNQMTPLIRGCFNLKKQCRSLPGLTYKKCFGLVTDLIFIHIYIDVLDTCLIDQVVLQCIGTLSRVYYALQPMSVGIGFSFPATHNG